MEAFPREIQIYVREDGVAPFSEWLGSLRDVRGRAKIRTRLDRLELGNFGDCRGVGDGVQELRIDYGPGYRIYFGQVNTTLILLLCGGDKASQARDIQTAKSYWQDYGRR
ncbi:type II toxin-antitoxin system RelE/ParE family toxin [Nitrospira moscoviensis]|uniref:type II toxin-antitoxin system RelE/ParE family toxin n=1 Tax=Nitrospira moscoviensis TaxID=42253 RepID=UPI0006A7D07A|nr:type II toxin-antitoxin system RelE/ParE family toxin [Nitrospira moscoviensis]